MTNWYYDTGPKQTWIKLAFAAKSPEDGISVVLPRNWMLGSANFGGIFLRQRIRPVYDRFEVIGGQSFPSETNDAYFATMVLNPAWRASWRRA